MRTYNKLVRDKIIDKIKSNNEVPTYRVLNDDEYLEELKKKLFEEYNELIEAITTNNNILEESADVLEVLLAINNYDLDKLLEMLNNKRNKNGAFKEKIYLEVVE